MYPSDIPDDAVLPRRRPTFDLPDRTALVLLIAVGLLWSGEGLLGVSVVERLAALSALGLRALQIASGAASLFGMYMLWRDWPRRRR